MRDSSVVGKVVDSICNMLFYLLFSVSPSANLPTTLRCEGDLMMKVVEQSQHKHEQIERPMIATPWQQYRADDEQPLTIAFCYVVVLLSRQNKEIWICHITSSSPNELIVVSYCFNF